MIKDRWTGSIADGSGSFLEGISDKLGTLAKGRSILEKEGALQLHENMETYNAVFNSKKEDTGVLNAYFWDANSMITVSYRGPTPTPLNPFYPFFSPYFRALVGSLTSSKDNVERFLKTSLFVSVGFVVFCFF